MYEHGKALLKRLSIPNFDQKPCKLLKFNLPHYPKTNQKLTNEISQYFHFNNLLWSRSFHVQLLKNKKMPVDVTLNFNFSPVQQTAINDALDALLVALNDPTVPYVNLTKEERKLPSIGAERLPYVHDAVDNILPLFPALASPSLPLPRTTNLLHLVGFIMSIKPKADEVIDRFTDLGLNAENLVYKSMTDSYNTAKVQEGRMPGADVLMAAIAPLFAAQGNSGTGPQPVPGDGNNNPTPTPTPTPGDGNNAP
jgi:hypothetical protein